MHLLKSDGNGNGYGDGYGNGDGDGDGDTFMQAVYRCVVYKETT